MSFRAARILTVLTLVAVPALATSVADARHPSTLRAVATQQCADANLHPAPLRATREQVREFALDEPFDGLGGVVEFVV